MTSWNLKIRFHFTNGSGEWKNGRGGLCIDYQNMELRHLRYFIAVAEEENVSRAALKLHVSQPGISRQIRDLEDELGFQLFERSAKSLKLTEAGKLFLTEALAVLQRAE